jgi:hypothetical protein
VRVLNIGPGPNTYNIGDPKAIYGDSDDIIIETMDVDPENNPTYLHDIRLSFPDELRDRYDAILMSHVLEHVEFWAAGSTIRNVCQALKVGGEITIIVPSFEWACRQVLQDTYTIGVMGVFYGGQQSEWDFHKAGYTILALRMLLEGVGLITRKAYTSAYVSTVNGVSENIGQNVVVAFKYQEVPEVAATQDPALALS